MTAAVVGEELTEAERERESMSGEMSIDLKNRKAGQSVFIQRIVAEANRRLRKNAVGLINENINPLWNIDERRAQQIYDFARSGNYAQLQYLYNEIEERDPTLLVCVTRRTSAVAELDWRVVRSNERLHRSADKNLVAEQIECIETAMARIDNMPDALEHLALSAFRGFAAVSPERNAQGEVTHLNLIDNWNLCYDKAGRSWWFNPTASAFMMPTAMGMTGGGDGESGVRHGLQYIPKEDICVVVRKREIDWPAMQIYLRAAVGERDWGRFLETYGLPPVIITMPEFTSKDEQAAYIQAAEDVFEGRSGVVPFGSEVNYASESRGTNPFMEFIAHQQKLVVMMATGGTLASLAESGAGTLAGEAQQDEWHRIIRADKRIISNAINKQLCEGIIRSCDDFRGQPVLAEFQLDDTPKPTPKEMLELASTASNAGFEMDAEELSRACGFTLRKKEEGGGFGGGGYGEPSPSVTLPDEKGDEGADGAEMPEMSELPEAKPEEPVATNDDGGEAAGIADNAPRTPSDGEGEFKADNDASSLQTPYTPNFEAVREEGEKPEADALNAEGEEEEAADAPTEDSPSQEVGAAEAKSVGQQLVASLQADFKPVADRIAEILAMPEAKRGDAASRLLAEIDALVPDDPAMAEVIAAEMSRAFDRQISRQQLGDKPAENNTKEKIQ